MLSVKEDARIHTEHRVLLMRSVFLIKRYHFKLGPELPDKKGNQWIRSSLLSTKRSNRNAFRDARFFWGLCIGISFSVCIMYVK